MARNKLTADRNTTNRNPYTTASINPKSNRLVLLFVLSSRQFSFAAPAVPIVTGNDLLWKQVRTVTEGQSLDRRLTCFRAMGTNPTPGAVAISFGSEKQDFCAWSVVEYDDVDTTGADGEGAVAFSNTATNTVKGTSLIVPLQASSDPTRNTTVAGIVVDGAFNEVGPGPGFSVIDAEEITQPGGKEAELQTEDANPALTAATWAWSEPTLSAGIALEIKASPIAVTTNPAHPSTPPNPPNPLVPQPTDIPIPVDALVARFEPILSFDPAEVHFPVNAKRFVEEASLWGAKPIFDTKTAWGGLPTDPFPRQPLVSSGQLAAIAGEPGEPLSDATYQASSSSDERFFELGGWKTKDGNHEAEVSDTSANAYADRSEIANRYREPELAKSRFWYHAEVISPTGVGSAADRVSMRPLLIHFQHPVLLCYYFFFPAHEQSVGAGDCPNAEAREVSCHAGDWQCFTVLLDSDGSGSVAGFTPKFFGITGSRPAPVNEGGTSAYRPHAFDAENRTVIKVEGWRLASGPTANQPDVEGEHARLSVALGTHSLYVAAGIQDVDPYPLYSAPTRCGKLDAEGLFEPEPPLEIGSGLLAPVAVALLKIVVGAFFGPIGAIVGIVSGVIEASNTVYAGPTPIPQDAPNPDMAPAPGDGITLRPNGITVEGVPPDSLMDWAVGRHVEIDGRTYDHIVDRNTQAWWPSADQQSGFRGRWGQQVTADSLGRRSGPLFPDYPKMFLEALGQGDADLQLDLNRP